MIPITGAGDIVSVRAGATGSRVTTVCERLMRRREGEAVPIKVIVELQAKPGMRGELMSLMERLVEQGATQHGFLGSTR